MTLRVLVTGGAGFIGSHLADELLRAGHRVVALDSLEPQVHGAQRRRPSYLDPRVELRVGDVRDLEAVEAALDGVDAVAHLAARVGVGQSMYELQSYVSVNSVGTAVLLEALATRRIPRLVVASSMSVYGEGLYLDEEGRRVETAGRRREMLSRHQWEPEAPDGRRLTPHPTPEDKRLDLASIYALTKLDQEEMCLLAGEAYGIAATALRLFNVYGPRQALSNPYTGVLAIFASRIMSGRPPLIFEDGLQRRDFVSVRDVARAFRLALEAERGHGVLNIGSGQSYTVAEIATRVSRAIGREIGPEVTYRYRVGDIRHCFADIERARQELRYRPEVSLEAGLLDLAAWLEKQSAPTDLIEEAREELEQRGLTL